MNRLICKIFIIFLCMHFCVAAKAFAHSEIITFSIPEWACGPSSLQVTGPNGFLFETELGPGQGSYTITSSQIISSGHYEWTMTYGSPTPGPDMVTWCMPTYQYGSFDWPAETTLRFSQIAPKDTAQFKYICFAAPEGAALDGAGNVYVADTSNNRIVKLSPDGAVLAAWGSLGSGSGQFNAPNGVAVDADGKIYVADMNNNRIVQLSPDGAVLAAWGSLGSGSGQFYAPRDVAVDAGGNIYVADTRNGRIVKLSPAGEVLDIWGSNGNVSFSSPNDVATDVDGNVYVADTGHNRIVKLSSSGEVLALWGTYGSGSGQFKNPSGVAVDVDGNVYVADRANSRVVKLSSSGAVLTNWGTYGSYRVAVAADGKVYVTNTSNCRIVQLSPSGEVLANWGSKGSGSGQFSYPQDVAVAADDKIYVADTGNHRIVQLSSSGEVLANWGSQGSSSGQFSVPRGVAVAPGGNIFVADTGNCRIVQLSPAGAVLASWGECGIGNGLFQSPAGVAVDANGSVYVADTNNHRIQMLSSSGEFLDAWGSEGYGDGQFQSPTGIAVDSNGNIYVADSDNSRIVKLAPDGTLVNWYCYTCVLGSFWQPRDVAVDAGGNVYVADTRYNRIVKLSPSGEHLATWGSEGNDIGQFEYPEGVAVDTNGNVYVADTENYRLQVGKRMSPATISGIPATPTNQSTATLTIGGSGWTKYKYRIDSGDWSAEHPVAASLLIAGLADGDHTVSVIGGDDAGLWQQEGTTATWTVQGGVVSYPTLSFPDICPLMGMQPYVAIASSVGGGQHSFSDCVNSYQSISEDLPGKGDYTWEASSAHYIYVEAAGGFVYTYLTDASGVIYWAHASSPPIATISNPPDALTNLTNYNLTLSGTGISQYKYRLDGGEWITVASASTPLLLSDLGDGSHTLDLLAADPLGNWQVTPTTYTWTVDVMPPMATVTTPPPSITNARDITLNVVAGDVVAYVASLDSAGFSAETLVGTPINLTGLSDGPHSVAILGRDAAGNWQDPRSATTYTFTVDTAAPVAVVSGAPSGSVNIRTATLAVSGVGVAGYQYSLDAGPWQAATAVATPIGLADLADGPHTVSVLGIDAAGNIQPQATPTTVAWVVDTTAPVAVITGTPGTPTSSKDATLTVSGTEVAAYRFTLDGGAPSVEFPAATPISLSNLPDGGHTLAVVARDAIGNWQTTPSTVSWVVDTDSPTAVLSGTPPALTRTTAITLVVSGTDVTHYRFRLDGGSFGAEIPVAQALAITGIPDGSHTVSVIGRDLAGNWQQTPATVSWTVDTQAPLAVLSGTPPNPSNATAATLVVSGAEVVAYRVAVDGGDFGEAAAVATPIALANLADGSHTVAVIGGDAAGNWQVTPTTVTWVVDTHSPTAVLAGVPASPANAAAATLIVNGTDVIVYRFKVDGGDFGNAIAVADRIVLTNLADGSHTVAVIGGDAAGNWQVTPTTVTWVVDTQAPLATIAGTPDTPTRMTSASLGIGGEGVSSYRYRVDGGDFGEATPVAAPIALTNLADGSHTVAVIGGDAAGNWQVTPTTVAWVVDTKSPTATITGKPAAVTNLKTATLTVGGSEVTAYRTKVDGGDFGDPIPVATPISLTGLSDGSHTVAVIGGDAAGNWQVTPTAVTWVVDTQAPVATLSGAPVSPTNASTASLTVGGTGVTAYRRKLDGGAYGAQTPVATKITLTGLAEGSHTLAVIGRDAAGNWQAIATTHTWVVDATPPATTVTGAPASPTNVKTATLTVGGSGVSQYKYKHNAEAWSQATPVATAISLADLADGDHTVSVLGRDAAGNWQSEASPTTVTWTVDTYPPAAATYTGQPDAVTRATGATFTIGNGNGAITHYRYSTNGIDWSGPVAIGAPLLLSDLGDGSHTLYLLVRDAAGNWQITPTTYTWTVDATPPTATVTTPPPSITNARDITLNVVAGDVVAYVASLDSAGFSAETLVGTPINLTGLSDGPHSVAILGRDAVGNWQDPRSATTYPFTVDTAAPVAVVSGAPSGSVNIRTATLTVSGVGVAGYQYSLDAGPWQAATAVATPIGLTDLADGEHTVSVLGIDAAGNIQPRATPTTVAWTVDTAAPVALITGTPGTPTASKDAALAISGAGVTQYRYKLDNGSYSATALPVGSDILLANLPDGGHVVSVIGGDAAGNWQSQATPTTAAWVVDTQAPTATLAGLPASPTTAKGAVITVAGPGVNLYQYRLDNGTFGVATDVATPITLANLADGSHTLAVKGRDLAGNWQATPTTAAWIVDTTAPVAVLSGAPGGSTNATTATITVSGTGVSAYRNKLDNGGYGTETPVATRISLSGLADGSHTVTVIGRDAAGNWQATPTTATWTVDTTAPSPVLTGAPTGVVNAAAATITVGGPDVSHYFCKLDSTSWSAKTPVATPIALVNLGNGSHTLSVTGCDAAGNCQSQAAPVTATWTVDTQAPAMPGIPAGSNPVRHTSTRPTLVWTAVADASDYLLEVADNAGFNLPRVQRVVASQTNSKLAGNEALTKPGMWFWRVRARDAAGNVSPWASASFTYRPMIVAPMMLLQ